MALLLELPAWPESKPSLLLMKTVVAPIPESPIKGTTGAQQYPF
jgi:hypothetical protein